MNDDTLSKHVEFVEYIFTREFLCLK